MATPANPADLVRTHCPHCGREYLVQPELVGRAGPCAACHQTFTIAPSTGPSGLPAGARNLAASAAPGPAAGAGTGAPVATREYALLEWVWEHQTIRLNVPGRPEGRHSGSNPEVAALLTRLGREGWTVTACAAAGNWILWTLQRGN